MRHKLTERITERITRFLAPPARIVAMRLAVAALAAFAAGGAGAAIDMTNPVTGATESYTYKFTGTDSVWNNTANWQDTNGSNPSAVPAKSGSNTWEPILFDQAEDQSIAIGAALSVEGWNLRMGLYNGANITLQHLVKLQSGMATWFTVDESSTLTIAGMDNNKLEGSNPLCLYSARANGITWTPALSNSAIGTGVQMPLHYYLTGDGTVAFNGGITLTSAQVIKRADVTLSEATSSKTVRSKTLVSFASSSTSTFSADAETTIKVKNSDGTALKDVNLTSVTATDTTLTTAGNVGDCELVQTSTGILLYYVDYAKTYKPSININFTNGAGNGLTTSADVGLTGYAVPGTSWNNFVVANNTTFNTVNAIDSTGAASVASGVSVSISGTRGHWNCANLTPSSNPLHGYIDESTDYPTPTVTITGIPYEHYRVIVYHSTDQNGAKFGYDTINGFNFTYVNGVQQTGTASWGSTGASNSAEPIAEGVNTLVSAVLSGDTVTMVAHRIGGENPTARGCFAAIQVVEYVPEVGENDLEIAVDGATSYLVDEAKTLSGTVYLTGSGTLTLTGSEKITAATIDVGKDVVLNIDAARLDATTFTGSGMVVYDGASEPPVTGKGWADIGWSGTVWVKNQAVSNFNGNNFGNAASTIRFTGVTGYLLRKTSDNVTQSVPIELVDDGNTVAFSYNNGWGGSVVSISTLKGTGTLKTSSAGNGEIIYIANADGFTGSFDLAYKKVQLGGSEPSGNDQYWNGRLYIPSGATATVASGATWSANNSIDVQGTLNVNGTVASSHASQAVIGSGTVVFTGRLPTPTGDAWWKNTSWTGTVQIDSLTGFVGTGTGTVLAPNAYGNTGSTLELKNCSGWLPVNYECSVPLSIAGTLTIGNGYSNVENAFTIDHLKGSGQITCNGSALTVLIYVREWSGYTGKVKMDNKMIVFGADTITASDLVSGTIYICEGAVVTNRNASHWEPAGNMKVNGTFAVTARSGWSDGKGAVLGENGIINFIGSGVDDHAYNFSNITGSGKILFTNGTGYSMLPSDAARMPSTDVAVVNDNTASYVMLTCTGTTTIGTLSGSGKFDSRYGNATTRRLAVVQGADSEWSGTFVNEDRVGGMDVSAKRGATAKTLTLSGTQTASNELVVKAATETTDAGSVNLTGTWIGATTVAGTFGGTGTLTGDLTFNAGATFKVFDATGDGTADTDANGLNVSGTVTYPAEGKVTVDVSALEQTGTKVLMTASDLDVSKFALASGQSGKLSVADGALKVSFTTYVAEYNGVPYETVQEAINAAVQAGQTYAAVIILDANATCPDEYYIDTENGNVLAKCQAALVDTEGGTHYFATPQAAVDEIGKYLGVEGAKTYDYYEVYYGENVAIAIDTSIAAHAAWAGVPLKIKCLAGASVAVTLASTESELTAGTPDENGIVTYTKTDKATTYVWAGATSDIATTAEKNYARADNWRVGTSSGATAARAPGSLDTVVFRNGAYASTTASQIVAALQVNGAVTIIGGGSLTSANAITLGTGDSITITGTLLPTPTTSVANSYVKATTVDGTTTYTVVAKSAVEIGDATFEYSADYTTAKTVTATVTGEVGDAAGTTWTLTVGDRTYDGTYNAGTVTFENVTVTPGSAFTYSIAAGGASSGSLPDQSAKAASVTGGWIDENSTNNNTDAAGGTWNPSITYSGTTAAFAADSTHTFTATSQASGIVTLTSVINFGAAADTEIAVDTDAKGAIRVADDNGSVFQLLTKVGGTAAWQTVSGATPNLESDSTVVFTFDTAAQTYSVKVNDFSLLYNENANFQFASAGDTIGAVKYIGAGTFTSLAGEYATTNIMASVDGANIVIPADFISRHLPSGMTAAEAAAALAPNASGAGNANGLNYFTCYALGLDPAEATDKPIVSVSVVNGNFVVSVTDKDGHALDKPANVSVTPKFYKYNPSTGKLDETAEVASTISPDAVVGEDNVGYIRAKIEINAK